MRAERLNPSRQNALVCRDGYAFLVRRPIRLRDDQVDVERRSHLLRRPFLNWAERGVAGAANAGVTLNFSVWRDPLVPEIKVGDAAA
jgi:hypothetical protein